MTRLPPPSHFIIGGTEIPRDWVGLTSTPLLPRYSTCFTDNGSLGCICSTGIHIDPYRPLNTTNSQLFSPADIFMPGDRFDGMFSLLIFLGLFTFVFLQLLLLAVGRPAAQRQCRLSVHRPVPLFYLSTTQTQLNSR